MTTAYRNPFTSSAHLHLQVNMENPKLLSPAHRLHDIALHCIFEATFPSFELDFLDPSLSRGPQNPWCRALQTKKSLPLVSQKWFLSAISYLYRDIVIRRVGGLLALAETLRAKPGYGVMVYTLRLDCYVPESLSNTASRSICLILDSCPNLETLSFGTFYILSHLKQLRWPYEDEVVDPDEVDSPCVMIEKGPMLKKISFVVEEYRTEYVLPLLLLRVSTQLVSLTLSVPLDALRRGGLGAMSFPALQELNLSLASDYTDAEAALIRSLVAWSIPSLTRLAIHGPPMSTPLYSATGYPANGDLSSFLYGDALWSVLEVHGSGLQFLDFSLCSVRSDRQYNLLQVCPRLRHLVLSTRNRRWPCFQSDSLHADVWLRHRCHEAASPFDFLLVQGAESSQLWSVKKAMQGNQKSALRTAKRAGCSSIRFLSQGLRSMLHLPSLLPPTQGANTGDYGGPDAAPHLHDIFGVRIVEWKSGVMLENEYRTDESYSLWPSLPDDDDDDESWTWDEQDERSTSSDEDDSLGVYEDVIIEPE